MTPKKRISLGPPQGSQTDLLAGGTGESGQKDPKSSTGNYPEKGGEVLTNGFT